MENTTKGRYWTFVIFQDNIEKNPLWKEKLCNTHLRFCVSPYHDKDLWSNDDLINHPDRESYIKEHLGEPKKAHYHVMIHCDDNTTYKTMKELLADLQCPLPQKVVAPDGLYRYFCHQDSPGKAQYDLNDIRHYNGSDPTDYLMEISKFRKNQIMDELTALIRAKRYIRFADIVFGVKEHFADPNYEYLVKNNVTYMKEILKDNLSDMHTSIAAEARKAV